MTPSSALPSPTYVPAKTTAIDRARPTLFRLRQAVKPTHILDLPDSAGWSRLRRREGIALAQVHPGEFRLEVHYMGTLEEWETFDRVDSPELAERLIPGLGDIFARGWKLDPHVYGAESSDEEADAEAEAEPFWLITTFRAHGFYGLRSELRWLLERDTPTCACPHH